MDGERWRIYRKLLGEERVEGILGKPRGGGFKGVLCLAISKASWVRDFAQHTHALAFEFGYRCSLFHNHNRHSHGQAKKCRLFHALSGERGGAEEPTADS